jgi:hypothetical protein
VRRSLDAEELKRLDLVERTRLRAKVKAEVQRRGLASVMNQTRWEELRAATHRLPFRPAFQMQTVLGSRELLWFSDQVTSQGCWCAECIEPFWAIEWIRILPRLWREEGALLPLKLVGDCAEALRTELSGLHLPFREDDRGFWIHGYAAGDPTLPPD